MNIGEMGNFISYAFAPASLVAPLGTVRRKYPSSPHVYSQLLFPSSLP